MKYIIMQDSKSKMYYPIVFDDYFVHQFMARAARVIVENGHINRFNPISAGFCRKDNTGKWYTYGESESLDLKPNPQDTTILNLFLEKNVSGLDLMNCLAFLEIQALESERDK